MSSPEEQTMAQRNYRVSYRVFSQFPEVIYFVSPVAHYLHQLGISLYGYDETQYPEILKRAFIFQWNRDIAKYASRGFSLVTKEELLASKISNNAWIETDEHSNKPPMRVLEQVKDIEG